MLIMIENFKCKETEKLYISGKSSKFSNVRDIALRKLTILNHAKDFRDLQRPPNNDFEQLKGKMKGFCSIRINKNMRLYFKFENGNAKDVYIGEHL